MEFTERLVTGLHQLGIDISADWSPIEDFSSITSDSRKVNSSTVFVAVPGTQRHGKDFLQDAIERGTKLALIDERHERNYLLKKQHDCLCIFIPKLSQKLPELLANLYPQLSLLKGLLAVTGTNGKTSVANLYAQLVASIGEPSGSIGTLGVFWHQTTGVAQKVNETINTTPDSIVMFQTLAMLADKGARYIAIEASSHGIEQGRLDNLPIDTVVFTNLSQDHLDYHKNMDAYARAKRSIIKNRYVKHVIVNDDDDESKNWRLAASHLAVTSFSLIDQRATFYSNKIEYNSTGIGCTLHNGNRHYSLALPLLGKFNLQNFMAVIAGLVQQGFSLPELLERTHKIQGIAGRMEVTSLADKTVLIDYAHTPDALEQALKATRLHTKNQLWVVFGCGGDRDTGKRKQMGAVSCQLADNIVLTEDNPRTEDPEKIVDDILQGITIEKPVFIEHDRTNAIRLAIAKSAAGDSILLAGKGHETYIEYARQTKHYDERKFVRELARECL